MGTGAEGLRHPSPDMTAIILVQTVESASWTALPGTYPTFQDARDMFEFIRPTLGPVASVAIEDAADVAPFYGINANQG